MPGAEARIERQQAHIQRALEKGKINQEQAAALQGKVDAVKAQREAAMADGDISKEERSAIKGALDSNKQEIKSVTHPAEVPSSGSGN